MNRLESLLKWAKTLTKHKGVADLIKHLSGKPLTIRQRVAATCARCSSGWDNGKYCSVLDCPLQPIHPYINNAPESKF